MAFGIYDDGTDIDPYEGDDYFLNLGLFGGQGLYGDEYGDQTPGQRALASLPGILRGIYARGRELSGNAGGYEDQDGDGIADGIYGGQGGLQGSPVNIVQRNEAGEVTGIVQGVKIGYGDNARVVTLDELASINEVRKREGQDSITTATPGYTPVYVDESGAVVSNETITGSSDSTTGTPSTTTDTSVSPIYTTPTPSIEDLGGGGGGGMRVITLSNGRSISVPENLKPLQLLTKGHITREIYKYITGEDAPADTAPDDTSNVDDNNNLDSNNNLDGTISPDETASDNTTVTPVDNTIVTPVDNTVVTPVDNTITEEIMTDSERIGLPADYTGTAGSYQYENGRIVGMSESSTDPDPSDNGADPDTKVTDPGVTDPGDDGTDPGGGTKKGPGDGSGEYTEEGFDYEKFFQMLGAIPAFQSGASFEEGEVPGIYPTAIQSLPQATAFINSILGLDRPVSEQQAQLKTDIYGNIIKDVREAQSPLMQSLAQRSEQLGAQAEELMGPLSFLEGRGATQTGYGQAAALGRAIDPGLREQQAGRLRGEQRNVNLQLASNLLGQQRATAGLMADIESGIYSRMAPDIGVDPGSILGIAGTDIQNILGEQAARQYSEALREGSRREQQAKFFETGISLLPQFGGGGGTSTIGGFKIPGTNIRIGGQQENSGSGSGLVGGLKILDVLD